MATLDMTKSFEELNPRHDTRLELRETFPPENDWKPVVVDCPVDLVNAPPHYTCMDPQPIDVIEAWGLDFHRAQVLKYIARAGRKGDAATDLKKAKFYLDRAIAIEEGK